MSTQYSLLVKNSSTQLQDICVYQKPVDLGVPNALSLAWLTARAWPGTTVRFKWTLDYNFVWAQTGSLKPGITFEAQQILPADPENLAENQMHFHYKDDAFTFIRDAALGTPERGSLYIRELDAVPPDTATVGIGMSNSGTFAVQAQPNTNLVFTPRPQYWITGGTFTHGEVMDLEQITNEAHVPYDGTFTMFAVLDSKNRWAVSSDAL